MRFNQVGTRDRREREKEISRSQILNAAKEIFMSKGLRTATMENIARKAELSPGTIDTDFKNKGELYVVLNLIGLQFAFCPAEAGKGSQFFKGLNCYESFNFFDFNGRKEEEDGFKA
jgi:hypothetical protein